MRFHRLAPLALLAAAACTQTPTSATVQHRPSFDGLGLGSGHVVMPGGTTATVAGSGETTTATDSTSGGRGGLGLGSGH
jgi:hypothetical protein